MTSVDSRKQLLGAGDMLTSEMRKRLLDEIEGYKIPLHPDPTVIGLRHTYEIQARLDSYRDRVGSIYIDALGDVSEMEKTLTELNFVYKMKSMQEMNKDTIKILKSADLRNSAVDTLLIRDLELIKNAEKDLITSKTFLSQVQTSYSDLKLKLETIENQLKIVGHMSGHGEFQHGNRNTPPSDKVRLVTGEPHAEQQQGDFKGSVGPS